MLQFISLLAWVALASTAAVDECQLRDYGPCICLGSGKFGLEVFCSIGEESDVHSVRKAFQRSTAEDHASVALEISFSSAIGADLLGGKRSRQIHLYGPQRYQFSPNQLDADVFNSSAQQTREVYIYDSDLGFTDWAWLERLVQLEQLYIRTSLLESLQTLPIMPNLHTMSIEDCKGQWAWPAGATPSLHTLQIKSAADLNQTGLESVLDSLPSNVQLLRVTSSKLSRIPDAVGRFNRLKLLDLSSNEIRTVPADRFPVMHRPEEIDMSHNGLELIHPDAFKGDFHGTRLDLSHNRLTLFEAAIFLPVLQSMAGSGGFIYLQKNPIRCDCDVAWLLFEHRPLLEHIWNGVCSDGVAFRQVDVSTLLHCQSNRTDNEA